MRDPGPQDAPALDLPAPLPDLDGATPAALRLHEVEVVVAPLYPQRGESRTAWLWRSARYLAERAVQHADTRLATIPEGEQRKALAVHCLREAFDELERRASQVLPARLVALVVRALDAAAPRLVEQAYRRLSRWAGGAA